MTVVLTDLNQGCEIQGLLLRVRLIAFNQMCFILIVDMQAATQAYSLIQGLIAEHCMFRAHLETFISFISRELNYR